MSAREAINPYSKQIIDTVLRSGLDRGRIVLFGGGRLALAGLRNAHDVDLVAEPDYMEELLADGQTPDGTPLARIDSGFKEVRARSTHEPAPGHLPIDINGYSGFGRHKLFNRLVQKADYYHLSDGAPMLCASMRDTYERKALLARQSRPDRARHVTDVYLIQGFFQRSENQPSL